MSELRVTIVADGSEREFFATGEPACVVAAFRAWLAGPEWEIAMAQSADEIEREVERMRLELAEGAKRERLLIEAIGLKL